MKKWVLFGIIGVLVLWLLAAFWTLPGLESSLNAAAQAALAKPEHLAAFDEVKGTFSGQEAQLVGIVTTQADKDKAGQIISQDLRLTSGLGSSLNPVIAIRNGIEVNSGRAYAKPQPWLVVSAFADQVRLAGIVADTASNKAVSDSAVKQAPAGKFISQISENDKARPAADWATTLQAMPDLKTAKSNAAEGIIAVSACDGKWTVFPGSTDDIAVANALGASATPTSSVSAALTDLRGWQAAEREKVRIASLPLAVAAVTIVPTAVHAFGTLGDPSDRKALIDGLTKSNPGRRIEDHTTLSGDVRPGADWTASLASLPTKIDAGASAVLRSGEKALAWTGTGAVDGIKKEFAALLPTAISPAALHEPIDTYLNEKKLTDEAAAKAAAEKAKTDASAKMAADQIKAEAAAKIAAEKAKAEAAKPAMVTPTATPPAAAAPASAPAAALTPAVTPALPAYLGWTINNGAVALFGTLPSTDALADAKKAAQAAYPGLSISTDGITIDAQRTIPAGATAKFAPAPEASKPQVGLAAYGSAAKTYAVDAFDSEIAKDWPQLSFGEGDIGRSLSTFREAQIKAGSLKQDDPYLSLMTDGKKLTVVGEVSDAATKDKLIAAIKAANPGFIIDDHLTITPLVRASGDLQATLDTLPKFELGKSGVAAARPGQKMRSSVLHAIYFQSGSDRSKDQERALYQVRRVQSLIPTAKFEVVGNTDNVGAVDANTRLSLGRADKFGTYLTAAGIAKDAFSTRGAGPAEPIADNATDAGKALNRRVDVLVK
jgi:outer membrane protein OmpA-like peptidoglycan-associated protein